MKEALVPLMKAFVNRLGNTDSKAPMMRDLALRRCRKMVGCGDNQEEVPLDGEKRARRQLLGSDDPSLRLCYYQRFDISRGQIFEVGGYVVAGR